MDDENEQTNAPAARYIMHWLRVKRQPFTTQDALSRLPDMHSHNCYLEPINDSEGISSNEPVHRTIQLKVVDAHDWYMTDPLQYNDVESVETALQDWSTFADDERVVFRSNEKSAYDDARRHYSITLDVARRLVDKFGDQQERTPFVSGYVMLNDDEAIIATIDRRFPVEIAEWQNVAFSFYEAACLGRGTARPWYFQESHPLQPHQRVFEKPLRNKPSPRQQHMRSVYAFPQWLDASAVTHVCDKSHLSLHCDGADPMWRDVFDAWPYVVDMMSASGYHVDDTQRDASAYLHCLLPDCQLKLAQSLLEGNDASLGVANNDAAALGERCAIVFVLRAANQSASTGVDSIKAIVNYAKLAKIDRVHVLSALPFSTMVQVDVANRRESPHLVLWPLSHHRFEWFNHTYAVPMAGLSSGDDDRGDNGGSRAPPQPEESERDDTGNNGATASSSTAVFDASRETILYNFVENVVLGGIFSKTSHHGVDEEGGADKQLTMSALGHLYESKQSFMKLASDSPATKRLGLKENDILHVQKRYPKTSKVMRRVVASSLAK